MFKRSFVFVLPLCLGCAPIYIAPSVHPPLFEKQGDATAAFQVGSFGVDGNAAYAFSDSLGVAANVSAVSRKNKDRNRHLYGDLGLVYYFPFLSYGRLEAVVGAGGGQSRGQGVELFTDRHLSAEGSYLRIYAQPEIAFASAIVDVGFIPRFSWVRYFYELEDNRQSNRTSQDLFFEPTAFLRLGYRFVKVGLQFGLVLPTGKVHDPQTQFVHLGMGISGHSNIFDIFLNEP